MKSIIGSSVPITDALPKATGETLYTGDLKLPGMVHGRLILSEVAAGRVKAIHTQEALKVPGVIRILTAEDFPDTAYNSALRFKGEKNMKATGIVRRVDDLGRIVIPKEIRRTLRIREGDPLQTSLTRWEMYCFSMLDLAKRRGW